MSYWIEKEEKRKYWIAYANKVLRDPKATEYECKTAMIGIGRLKPEMLKALKSRKYKTLKLS